MEKKQERNKILKLLPKAASTVTFQPHRNHTGNGAGLFSGPIGGRKKKSKPSSNNLFESDYQEPTSPKISCIGQIKNKKKQQQQIQKSIKTAPFFKTVEKTSSFKLKSFLLKSRRSRSDDDIPNNDISVKDEIPSLSQMKRFSSGRDAFTSFDWTAQIAPPDQEEDFYDEDRTDEIIIPFSAPMLRLVGDNNYYHENEKLRSHLQPKKEINLWKRRTMDPPRPLQLNNNTIVKAR